MHKAKLKTLQDNTTEKLYQMWKWMVKHVVILNEISTSNINLKREKRYGFIYLDRGYVDHIGNVY